jgi:hypothetical protein
MAQKLAPRLAVAYYLRSNQRMRLFVNWGRYFDWSKYELARNAFGGNTWKTWYRAIDDSNLTAFKNARIENGRCVGCAGTDLWHVTGSFRDRRRPDFSGLDPEIKPVSQDTVSGGIDLEMGAANTLQLHFVRNHLNRTIEDVAALVDGKQMYIYGNPGEGLAATVFTTGSTPPFESPKPRRNYDALQASWNRRFAERWTARASYTLSRLWGNYPGIQNSDEIRTPALGGGYPIDQAQGASTFRTGGYETRAWDLDESLWDAHGILDVTGVLPTDRTDVIKLLGAYEFPTRTALGFNFYAGSGTPVSTYVNTTHDVAVFVNGRGDIGPTPFLTQTDLLVSHDLKMPGNRLVRLELNVLNVFNQQTARHIFNYYNRGAGTPRPSSAIDLSAVDLRKGYDYLAMVATAPDSAPGKVGAKDPRYRLADLFNPPLQAYLTAKFIF